MSSVKNDNPLANLWNTVVKETGRAAGEAGKLMSESINDIGKATESGGAVGGVLQAFEEISPGNFAAGAVDVLTGPGQLNPQLAAGIRGAVNFATSLVPGVGVMAAPLQLQALKDAATAFGFLGGTPQAGGPDAQGAPGATQTQTPERPTEAAGRKTGREALDAAKERKQEAKAEARRELIAAIKEKAVDRMKEKAQNDRIAGLEERVSYLEQLAGVDETKPNGGYGGINDGFGAIDFPALTGGDLRKGVGRLKDNINGADDEVSRLLNDPNLSFEDLIFALMNVFVKQQQKEVKDMTKDLRGEKSTFDAEKTKSRAAIDAQENKISDLRGKVTKNPQDAEAAKQLGLEQTKLRGMTETFGDRQTEFSDSRQEKFEAIKNAMNKLTEMQQALSNILNNMHQTAMSTIGNIR